MSFKASADIPEISRADLHDLNELVKPQKGDAAGARPIDDLKLRHRRWMERRLMQAVSQSEFMVLSAIAARTFSWSKAVEIIPLSVFTDGLRDRKDSSRYAADDEGMPIFAGTGLGKSTVQRALAALAENRLIERFQVPGAERNVCAYMPVSALTLFFALGGSGSAGGNVTLIPDGIMNVIRVCKPPPQHGSLEQEFQARWVAIIDRDKEKSHAA